MSLNDPILVSDFRIEETSPTSIRYLILSGRAKPFRPLRYGGDAVLAKHRHQGNPEKVFQILGDDAGSTQIKGRWKAEYISSGQIRVRTSRVTLDSETLFSFANPAQAGVNETYDALRLIVEAIEELRAEAPEFYVSWNGLTKRGVISSFWYEFKDPWDVDWEMSFSWKSYSSTEILNEFDPLTTVDGKLPDLHAKAEALSRAFSIDFDAFAFAMKAYQLPGVSHAFNLMNDIDRFKSQVDTIVSDLGRVSEMYGSTLISLSPARIARGVIGTLLNVKDTFTDMMNYWTRSFPRQFSDQVAVFSDWHAGRPSAQGLNTFSYGSSRAREIADLVYDTTIMLRNIKEQQQPKIRDAVTSTEGQHIGSIAREFFSWDDWPVLARYNGIEAPIMDAGTVVLIPTRLPVE